MKKIFFAIFPSILVTAFAWTISNVLIKPEEAKNIISVNPVPMKKEKAQEPPIQNISQEFSLGEKQAKKCKACHSLKKDKKIKIGPPLWSIVGAKKARTTNFKYSEKLQNLGGIWSEEELSKFIKVPNQYIPGTKMLFKGIKNDEDRKNLIIFLKTLTDENNKN